MGFETSRAFAVEIFSTIDTIQTSRLAWDELIEESRRLHKKDKELLNEFMYLQVNLRPFVETILRLYFQQQNDWYSAYTQTLIPDYITLIEYVREQVEEALSN
jgi:hypothetical protein